MNSLKFFQDALSSLYANKLRTALTMLGIIIGVAAVISMLAIGQGASSSITSQIEAMGTNLIYVSTDRSVSNFRPLTLADSDAITSSGGAPSVLAVAPSVTTNSTVTYAGSNLSTSIMGITPEYATVRNESVQSGRFISQEDMNNYATVAVIGSEVAEELFGSGSSPLGNKMRIGNNLYQVVGVLEKKGGTAVGSSDNQVLVPITTAQVRIITQTGTYQEVNLISTAAVSAETIESAISEISNILRNRHNIRAGYEDDFMVMSQEAFTEAATQITGVLTVFLGGIAAISLLVGGIGIMNIMLVAVIERTKEIGLRKAVGARDRDIMLQFLVEAFIIGLFGGLLGVLLGWGISSLVSRVATWGNTALEAKITFDAVLLSVLFSISVGLVFGLYPARHAARLEPVEALRTE